MSLFRRVAGILAIVNSQLSNDQRRLHRPMCLRRFTPEAQQIHFESQVEVTAAGTSSSAVGHRPRERSVVLGLLIDLGMQPHFNGRIYL